MALSLGPWAIPVPQVEGVPAATLILGVIELPTVRLADGDMNIFTAS